MGKEELGQELHTLSSEAEYAKRHLNHYKIELGMLLLKIHDVCSMAELEGFDDISTFNQFLATIHLNRRRVIQLIDNAEFIRDCEIDKELWQCLDSSVVDMFRKKNINPLKHWDDILTLSYTDLKQLYGISNN